MDSANAVKNGDFVELKYTGLVDGKVFDSNIEEDLKKLNDSAKPDKTIIIVGQSMVVHGLDKFLAGKELGKEYSVTLAPKDAFGSRRKEFVKTIPLKVFHSQKIEPRAGATFIFDNQLAKIIAVSGARVITDFNNPLAGKDVTYKFTIARLVQDLKEKTEAVCKLALRYVPEIEVENNSVTVKGPAILENYIKMVQPKFKEFLGHEVAFKVVEDKKEEQVNPEV